MSWDKRLGSNLLNICLMAIKEISSFIFDQGCSYFAYHLSLVCIFMTGKNSRGEGTVPDFLRATIATCNFPGGWRSTLIPPLDPSMMSLYSTSVSNVVQASRRL